MNFRKIIAIMMTVLFIFVLVWSVNRASAGWAVHDGFYRSVGKVCKDGVVVAFTEGIGFSEEFGIKVNSGTSEEYTIPEEALTFTPGPESNNDLPAGIVSENLLTKFWTITWESKYNLEIGDMISVSIEHPINEKSLGAYQTTCDLKTQPVSMSQYRFGSDGERRLCGLGSKAKIINVPANLYIYDLDVDLNLSGINNSATVKLKSPSSSTPYQLFSGITGSQKQLGTDCKWDYSQKPGVPGIGPNIILDDEGGLKIDEYPNTEHWFRPQGNLATFDRQSSKGDWELIVEGADLDCWCMDILGWEMFMLNVTSSSNGRVTKSPYKENYNTGEKVTLQAIPDPGYKFQGWSGDASGSQNPLELTMYEDKSISAAFIQDDQPTPPPPPDNEVFLPVILGTASNGGNPAPTATPSATPTATPSPTPTSPAVPPSWQEVNSGSAGGGGISQNGGSSEYPSLALSPGNNTPFVAWHDDSAGDLEIYVRSWNGSSWVDLGGSASGGGISSNSGSSEYPYLAVNGNNTAYVVWHDDSSGGYQVYLKYWNGSSWQQLGGSASGKGLSNSSGTAREASVAVGADDRPYVAYRDKSSGNYEIYLKYWNGSSWQQLGGSATGGGISSNSGYSGRPIPAVSQNGDICLSWHDATPGDFEIYLKCWNGSSWVAYGGSASGGGISDSSGKSVHPTMALSSNGQPYVAWFDNENGDNEIYLKYWNGSSWAQLGGSASGGGISNNSGDSIRPAIAMGPGNKPHISWQDTNGDNEIYTRYWNGSSWSEHESGSAGSGGISSNSGSSEWPSLAFGSDGVPYIAWFDFSSGDSEIYVKRWK